MKFFPLLLLCAFAPLLQAQTPTATPPPTNIRMWRANLPGGSYSVALHAIVSVSSHEYLVDGNVRVTEVNIDTNGNALARFYYIEPNTPTGGPAIANLSLEKAQQLINEASDKAGTDAWRKVVKNYPTTTHTHTIEYRMADKDTLQKLFDSAESALRLNKNTTFDAK